MPLKMRPTGLGSGIDKDRPDYTVFCGGREVGRIYETRGGPDSLRWFWSMTVNGPMTRADRVATLERGKGAVSEELGRLEGVGEIGGGAGRIVIEWITFQPSLVPRPASPRGFSLLPDQTGGVL